MGLEYKEVRLDVSERRFAYDYWRFFGIKRRKHLVYNKSKLIKEYCILCEFIN